MPTLCAHSREGTRRGELRGRWVDGCLQPRREREREMLISLVDVVCVRAREASRRFAEPKRKPEFIIDATFFFSITRYRYRENTGGLLYGRIVRIAYYHYPALSVIIRWRASRGPEPERSDCPRLTRRGNDSSRANAHSEQPRASLRLPWSFSSLRHSLSRISTTGSRSRSDESDGRDKYPVRTRSEGSRDRRACRHGLRRMRVSSLNSAFALIEIVRVRVTHGVGYIKTRTRLLPLQREREISSPARDMNRG